MLPFFRTPKLSPMAIPGSTFLTRILFTPRGAITVFITLTWCCYLLLNAVYAKGRYDYWADVYEKKKIYNNQDVCINPHVKAQLEGENRCDENAIFLMTYPWVRAASDVAQANYMCAGGSCVLWGIGILFLFVVVSVVLGYVVVNNIRWFSGMLDKWNLSIPMTMGDNCKQHGKYL